MAIMARTDFAAIWRPVFAQGVAPEHALARAWARTQQFFAQQYGSHLTEAQCQDLLEEMTVAWLLRALAPGASASDTELSTLAQQAALALGLLRYDLARVYEGYFQLLEGWGVYR